MKKAIFELNTANNCVCEEYLGEKCIETQIEIAREWAYNEALEIVNEIIDDDENVLDYEDSFRYCYERYYPMTCAVYIEHVVCEDYEYKDGWAIAGGETFEEFFSHFILGDEITLEWF